MMSDVAHVAAATLREDVPFVLVTGRPTGGLEPFITAAQRHVVSPGPATRLAVAAGIAFGGHRAVAVVDDGCAFAAGHGEVAVTESPAAAVQALGSGWSVVQPWSGADVASLLTTAPRPALLLLPADTGVAPPEPVPRDVPPPRRLRVWQDGELATLVASGAAVGSLVRLGDRLHARGVPVTMVEVAVLTSPDHAPLVGGDALYVGAADAGQRLAGGAWPRTLARVPLTQGEDADLIGAVLSHIRTA